MRREFVSYSQPIRFVRLDSEYVQSDGKSAIHELPVLNPARGQESWAGPTPEVRDSRTSRQIWQIWLAENTKRILCACSERIKSSGLVQQQKSTIHRLPVKSSKSDWLRIRNEYSAHAQKIGSGQSSRSLPQARRIVGSGDENDTGPVPQVG